MYIYIDMNYYGEQLWLLTNSLLPPLNPQTILIIVEFLELVQAQFLYLQTCHHFLPKEQILLSGVDLEWVNQKWFVS